VRDTTSTTAAVWLLYDVGSQIHIKILHLSGAPFFQIPAVIANLTKPLKATYTWPTGFSNQRSTSVIATHSRTHRVNLVYTVASATVLLLRVLVFTTKNTNCGNSNKLLPRYDYVPSGKCCTVVSSLQVEKWEVSVYAIFF
jgi:hypothetical protein